MSNTNDRSSAIVAAAYRVLNTNGLAGFSFDAVAKEADLSRQLLRYYYKDLESLVLDLADQLAVPYRDTLLRLVGQGDGKERLSTFLDFYFDLIEAAPKPRDDQAYDAVLSYAASSADVKAKLRLQYELLANVVSHEVQLEYPSLRAEHANEIAYLFVVTMYGHWKMAASLGFPEERKTVARAALERLIRSYLQT
ncbi:MAG: TetR/AcrR family transcriptional regulator [Pseudomonadota bacterium]